MSRRYVSIFGRLKALAKAGRAAVHQAVGDSALAQVVKHKLKRDPINLIICLFIILCGALIINPGGTAPYLANVLALLPTLTTLRHIDRPRTTANIERGRFLLDYWLCVGTSIMLEQALSTDLVEAAVPIWWLVKGLAGVGMWVKLNLSSGPTSGAGRQRALTLDSTRSRVIDRLPEAEPSPSPVADVMSALLQGFPRSTASHDGSSTTASDLSPVDTASFLRDDQAPFTVLHSQSADAVRRPTLETVDPGHSHEFAPSEHPMTPRSQLDALLDSAAGTYSRAAYEDSELKDPAQTPHDQDNDRDFMHLEGELSPAFVLDFPSGDASNTAPARLPSAESGGAAGVARKN